MARRAINIELNGQGIQAATFNDFSFLGTQKDASGVSVYSGAAMPSYVTSLGNVAFNQGETKTYTAENGSVYKRIIQGSYNITTATLQADGFSNWDISIGQTSYISQNWLGFVVDDDTQEGWIVVITLYRENTYLVNYYYSKTNNQDTYYFIGNEYVPYHWSSVPAISGKNGILSLTQILNINDGSPMNDVQYDGNLDFSAKSKVNNMISEVVIDVTAVKVEFKIPSGDYSYAKFVYKKGKIPKDINDGTAFDIAATDTSISLHGIADGSTYWFVIFTDKSESGPYEFNSTRMSVTEKLSDIIKNMTGAQTQYFTGTDSGTSSQYYAACASNLTDILIFRHSSSHSDNLLDFTNNRINIDDITDWSDYKISYPLKFAMKIVEISANFTITGGTYHVYDWSGCSLKGLKADGTEAELSLAANFRPTDSQNIEMNTKTLFKETLEDDEPSTRIEFYSNYGDWTVEDIYVTYIKG